MDGFASSNGAPDGAPLRTVADAVAARLGSAAIVDFSYPRCSYFAPDRGNIHISGLAGPDAIENRFLGSFRQSGGHAPVRLVDGKATHLAHVLPDHMPIGPGTVLVVDSRSLFERLTPLVADLEVAFMMPLGDGTKNKKRAKTAKGEDRPSAPGFDTVLLAEEGGHEGFWLMVPAGRSKIAAPFETVAAKPPATQVFAARNFIHDGGHVSEGDDAYSWIWTGPAQLFRIVVPRGRPGWKTRVEVSVIRTENNANLTNIFVQVDGRNIPFTFERWSEQSGKIVLELPPPADYTILGVGVPHLDNDRNSGRLIGLCIDKLIVKEA
jgi:hypothetical protein